MKCNCQFFTSLHMVESGDVHNMLHCACACTAALYGQVHPYRTLALLYCIALWHRRRRRCSRPDHGYESSSLTLCVLTPHCSCCMGWAVRVACCRPYHYHNNNRSLPQCELSIFNTSKVRRHVNCSHFYFNYNIS